MRFLGYIALVLVLVSCERQIPLKNFKFEEKLVVNGYNHNNSPIYCWLSTSVSTLGVPALNSIEGEVEVLLKEDNHQIHYNTAKVINGYLELPLTAKVGKTYELQIKHDSLPPVRMIDKIPEESPSVELNNMEEDNYYLKPSVTVSDIASSNYFMLQTYIEGFSLMDGDTTWHLEQVKFEANEKIFITNINNQNTAVEYALFDDAVFKNGNLKLRLNIPKHQINQMGFKPVRIEVRLSSMSAKMYNYYLALLENNHIYGGPLATYTISSGNVENGLGIFSFYTYKRTWAPLR